MNEAQKLRQAREAAGFSPERMADLMGRDVPSLVAVEAGKASVGPELLDQYARMLGVSVERLLLDDIERAPAPLLFRSLHGTSSLDELATIDYFALGDFLRTTGDIADLAERMERHGAPPWRPLQEVADLTPEPPPAEAPMLYRRTERLAMMVRERLGMELLTPINSMVSLIEERLGVPIVFVSPEQLDRDIDGASTWEQTPGILVNLVGGPQCWWRTRMTLAHELCHLLFDAVPPKGMQRRHFFMFSPDRERRERGGTRRRYVLPEDLELVERRANVFAAHLLAPGTGIRALVSQANATSEDAITLLRQHFGIGRITAVNQLTNTFQLSKEERQRMLDRSPASDQLPQHHDDARVPLGGRRCHLLEQRTCQALAAGWIGKVYARDLLGLRTTDSLSIQSGLSEELRAPIRTIEQMVGVRAQAYLGSRPGTGTWIAGDPVRDGERWRIPVFEVNADGTQKDRGTLVLSQSPEVLESESRLIFDGAAA